MLLRKLIVIFSVLGLGSLSLDAQVDPSPQRGIMPGTLQVASGDDDISLNSLGLLYRASLYRFPGGPGSVPMDVGLVYNSFIWETAPCTIPGCYAGEYEYSQSSTGGGWSYSFDYQLAIESAVVNQYGKIEYRVTVIFPDGSNHVLRPKGVTPDAGNGFYPVVPGSSGTTPYLSDDGIYARVEISAGPSPNPPWKLFLADGTTASYTPNACTYANYGLWGPVSETGYLFYANKITDRNGNFLTVCSSASLTNTLEPEVTITDQAGRVAKLKNNSQGDVLTAPGANGQMLTWNVNWSTFTSQYQWGCASGISCSLPPVLMVQSVQLPQVNGDNLQYQFSYPTDSTSTLQLQQVNTPYGAIVSYVYSGIMAGPQHDPQSRNADVRTKTITWTDPQGAVPVQQWIFDGTTFGKVLVTSPDAGQTEYDFCSIATVAGTRFCKITYPNLDVTTHIWLLNCTYGGYAYTFLSAELHTVQKSTGPLSSARQYVYDRNGNLVNQYEWDWSSGTLTSPPPTSTAARTMTNTFALAARVRTPVFDRSVRSSNAMSRC